MVSLIYNYNSINNNTPNKRYANAKEGLKKDTGGNLHAIEEKEEKLAADAGDTYRGA